MIINDVDLYLQYTSLSAKYCYEYIYHITNAAGAWRESARDYHDSEARYYLELFNEAFKSEYPMFKDYSFKPMMLGGVPCCTVLYEISPRIFTPNKDF
jgi:hypothetical protein